MAVKNYDAIKRRSVDRMLALYFSSLDAIISHWKLVHAVGRGNEDVHQLVSRSRDLCLEIKGFLGKEIGELEAEIFDGNSDRSQTSSDNPQAGDIESRIPQVMIDSLSHRYVKLKGIIVNRIGHT